MIQIFCNEKGSGKTKALVNLANDKVLDGKGTIAYIDNNKRMLFELDNRIRFICAEDFKIRTYKDFEGFLCGVVSQNYDIEAIMIDSIINKLVEPLEDSKELFSKIEYLSDEYNIDFYINISGNYEELPQWIKKYARDEVKI